MTFTYETPADSMETNQLALERLEKCIERAVSQTRFCNVFGQRFDAPTMHELYARKRHRDYRLSGARSIEVHECEINDLVMAITPMVARYRSSDTV